MHRCRARQLVIREHSSAPQGRPRAIWGRATSAPAIRNEPGRGILPVASGVRVGAPDIALFLAFLVLRAPDCSGWTPRWVPGRGRKWHREELRSPSFRDAVNGSYSSSSSCSSSAFNGFSITTTITSPSPAFSNHSNRFQGTGWSGRGRMGGAGGRSRGSLAIWASK